MSRILFVISFLIIVFALYLYTATGKSGVYETSSSFPDRLIIDLTDEDGINGVLISDFRFIDPEGRTWTAEAGLPTDGASIPKPLWTLLGGPYTGRHRKPAMVHDQYCRSKTRPSDQVHKMFYDALIASGEDRIKAAVMYFAVYRFGPHWNFPIHGECEPGMECVSPPVIWKGDFRPDFTDGSMAYALSIEEKVEAAFAATNTAAALELIHEQIISDIEAEIITKIPELSDY